MSDAIDEQPKTPSVQAKQVIYCQICTIPPEYCQYGATREKCKKSLASSGYAELYAVLYPEETKEVKKAEGDALADAMSKVNVAAEQDGNSATAKLDNDESDEAKKHQTRGGKGLPRDHSGKLDKEAQKRAKAKVIIHITERNKRKAITGIRGLEVFGLDLKKVAKRLAGKYACGCSVVKTPAGIEEIALQGDFMDDVAEFIPSEYPEVGSHQVEVIYK